MNNNLTRSNNLWIWSLSSVISLSITTTKNVRRLSLSIFKRPLLKLFISSLINLDINSESHILFVNSFLIKSSLTTDLIFDWWLIIRLMNYLIYCYEHPINKSNNPTNKFGSHCSTILNKISNYSVYLIFYLWI